MYTLTVGIQGVQTSKVAGLDIAASDGNAKLAPVTTGVVLSNGEIVHQAPLTLAAGGAGAGKSVKVQFNVTAPATNGTLTLYADGVVGDGVDSTATSKGLTTKLDVTVTGGTGNTPPPAPADMAMSSTTPPGSAPADMAVGTTPVPSADMAHNTNTAPTYGCSVAAGGADDTGAGAALMIFGCVAAFVVSRRLARRRA
jgi:hypothetical protein